MSTAERRWARACGYTGPYRKVRSHCKSYRHRPACAGRIAPLDAEADAGPMLGIGRC
jgi:hypothetical protein